MLDCDLTTLSDAKMSDIDTAAERIASAISAGEAIALCSDYDADGWGCCVIFEEMMKLLEYDRYIVTANSRSDGYGISTDFVQRLLDNHPDVTLIITADNGIQAFDAVAWLTERNVTVSSPTTTLSERTGRCLPVRWRWPPLKDRVHPLGWSPFAVRRCCTA